MIAFVGIYRRELGRLLASSGVTIYLPLGLAWLAWQRYHGSEVFAGLDPLDTGLRLVALVLAPLAVWMSAPAFSAERQTATLWAISPVRAHTVLLGKFLAIFTVLTGALLLLVGVALGVDALGAPLVRLLCGLLGLWLLALPVVAVTLLASALVGHFSTAFAWGMALLFSWVCGVDVLLTGLDSLAELAPALTALAPLAVLSGWDVPSVIFPLFLGWLDLAAVVVVLVATLLLLLVTHQLVGSERWHS